MTAAEHAARIPRRLRPHTFPALRSKDTMPDFAFLAVAIGSFILFALLSELLGRV